MVIIRFLIKVLQCNLCICNSEHVITGCLPNTCTCDPRAVPISKSRYSCY